jgi:uncharacterized glyoxalase superfamily protein PhnB
MKTVAQSSGSRSYPALCYREVGFAASWLCAAFGFEQHSTTVNDDGRVNYAELSFGNTIIMLGAIGGFEVDNLMRQPDEIGGAETQCSYFVVSDLDFHYARACDAGAKIVLEIKTHLNGTRGYTCADPEGHLWNFGTYDPWRRLNDVNDVIVAAGPVQSDGSSGLRLGLPDGGRSSAYSLRPLVAGISVSAVVFGLILVWASAAPWQRARAAPASLEAANGNNARAVEVAHRLLAFERTKRRIAERRSAATRGEVAQERRLRVAAEQAAHELDQKFSNARRAKDLAQSAMILARQELDRAAVEKALFTQEMEVALADERSAKENAQRFATKMKAQLSEVQPVSAAQGAQEPDFVTQSAKQSAAEALEEARKQVIIKQAAHAAAELATKEARDALARERSSNLAAKRKIVQLKKRLAMVEGGSRPAEKSNTPAAAKSSKGGLQVAPTDKATPPPPDGWDLSHGPVF